MGLEPNFLFGASLLEFCLSMRFRGDMLLARILPFIGLLIINKLLCLKLIQKNESFETPYNTSRTEME